MQTDGSSTIGICGAGQMGAAAAVSFKRAGYRVLLWARNADRLNGAQAAMNAMDCWLDENVGPPAKSCGEIRLEPNLSAVDADVDVVMDCIGEDLDQKAELFNRLPAAKSHGAIFMTTTSGLSITRMGRMSGCGERLVGTHFWNPPHLMPLVEVIRGDDTRGDTVEQVCTLIESLGKKVVRVNRDVPGFIGNRLLHAMWREAINIVERGIASAEDVDAVAKMTFGLRMPVVGPLENMDLVGLDLIEKIHAYLLADLSADEHPSPLLTRHVADGHIGMKSASGFYDWSKRDPDELIRIRDTQIVNQLKSNRKNQI